VSFSTDGGAVFESPLGADGATVFGPSLVLGVGSSVTASYSGDSAFGSNDATPLGLDILPATTATQVSSAINPAAPGSTVAITAAVSNTSDSVPPRGSVSFTGFPTGTLLSATGAPFRAHDLVCEGVMV
jgi:hypothetical protein